MKKTYKYGIYFLSLFFATLPLFGGTIYVSSCDRIQNSQNPLIDAINKKDIEKTKEIIKTNKKLVNEPDGKIGITPLMCATDQGNVDLINILASSDADLEGFDWSGNTALMYLFYGSTSKVDAIKAFLSLNPCMKVMNNSAQTPLILATLNDQIEAMELLIKNGVNIEERGRLEMTPLLHAIDNSNFRATELLLKYGADKEVTDKIGFTPLMLAALRGDVAMIKILLKYGAKKDVKSTKVMDIEMTSDPFSSYFDRAKKNVKQIPKGSTALDIAKIFEKKPAIVALES